MCTHLPAYFVKYAGSRYLTYRTYMSIYYLSHFTYTFTYCLSNSTYILTYYLTYRTYMFSYYLSYFTYTLTYCLSHCTYKLPTTWHIEPTYVPNACHIVAYIQQQDVIQYHEPMIEVRFFEKKNVGKTQFVTIDTATRRYSVHAQKHSCKSLPCCIVILHSNFV